MTGIDVSESDQHPQKVCSDCLDGLEEASKIKTKALETNEKFVRSNEEKIKMEIDDHEDDYFVNDSNFVDVSMVKFEPDPGPSHKISTSSEQFAELKKKFSIKKDPEVSLGPLKRSEIPPSMLEKPSKFNPIYKKLPTKNLSIAIVKKRKELPDSTCPNCDKIISFDRWIYHKSTCHETYYYCEICRETIKFKKNYSSHIQKHIDNKDKPLKTCEKCQQKFYTRDLISSHPCFAPKKGEPVPCLICWQKFPVLNKVFNHMIQHHRCDGVFRCPMVGCQTEPFQFPKNMHFHIDSHINPIPRICRRCGELFEDELLYKVHYLKHENRVFYCDKDGREFLCKNRLKTHMVSHINRGSGTFSCTFCGATYGTLGKVKRHEANEHGTTLDYQCEICGKW